MFDFENALWFLPFSNSLLRATCRNFSDQSSPSTVDCPSCFLLFRLFDLKSLRLIRKKLSQCLCWLWLKFPWNGFHIRARSEGKILRKIQEKFEENFKKLTPSPLSLLTTLLSVISHLFPRIIRSTSENETHNECSCLHKQLADFAANYKLILPSFACSSMFLSHLTMFSKLFSLVMS